MASPPPSFENRPNRDRLSLRNIAPRTLRSLGELSRKLLGRDSNNQADGFRVEAEPLHYRSDEAQAEVDAGKGLTTDDTLEIMRETRPPENPNEN